MMMKATRWMPMTLQQPRRASYPGPRPQYSSWNNNLAFSDQVPPNIDYDEPRYYGDHGCDENQICGVSAAYERCLQNSTLFDETE